VATAHAREVDVGQCLRATLDVDENGAQQTPMSNLARFLQLGNEPRRLREALAEPRQWRVRTRFAGAWSRPPRR
jgi:hypothetical protein